MDIKSIEETKDLDYICPRCHYRARRRFKVCPDCKDIKSDDIAYSLAMARTINSMLQGRGITQ